MYRISIDGQATTGMAVRPARATPDALGVQVAELIKRFAPRAKRRETPAGATFDRRADRPI